MSVYVDVFATHFLETSIWTAKSTTKIKAMQLIDWCKPFTSEKRNWNTNTAIIDKNLTPCMLVSDLLCTRRLFASPKLDQ